MLACYDRRGKEHYEIMIAKPVTLTTVRLLTHIGIRYDEKHPFTSTSAGVHILHIAPDNLK